ncbi:MAG: hypothetical protein HY372_01345 [Candidatus Andersenbacteria bacterium]|nr:hypothetical protein [Candidatus Andersenbacteria bacterium]
MVFDESIHLVTRCPFCSAEYDLDGAQVIGEENDATMVYITCSECESSIVAIVAMSGLGIVSLGLVTDMTVEDTKRFMSAKQLTSDEFIEVYELLEKNQHQALKKLTLLSK